jgi:N-formylglutamate deformylase
LKVYNLWVPERNRIPLVASIPHSGSYVPPEIIDQFNAVPRPALVPLDWHLEKLYDFLPELGITVIQATHSRYVVNLNRALTEPLFGPENACIVPDMTCFRKSLYTSEPARDQVKHRIESYYTPYHDELKRVIDGLVRQFGRAYLVDLHGYYRGPEVDVCLGDVYGTTCSERLTGIVEDSYLSQGFNVVRNELWIGGYITRHYGAMENVEALQIELRFPCYLEGAAFEEEEVPGYDSEKFRDAGRRIRRVFQNVVESLFTG